MFGNDPIPLYCHRRSPASSHHLLAEVLVVGAEKGRIAATIVRALGRLRARDNRQYAELALPFRWDASLRQQRSVVPAGVCARTVVVGDDVGEVLRGEPPHHLPNGRVDLRWFYGARSTPCAFRVIWTT